MLSEQNYSHNYYLRTTQIFKLLFVKTV